MLPKKWQERFVLWRAKRRFASDLRLILKRDRWEALSDHLALYCELLEGRDSFKDYRIEQAAKVSLKTTTLNVNELVLRLRKLNWYIANEEVVERTDIPTATASERTLEEYLVSNRGRLITPVSAVSLLSREILDFTSQMQDLHAYEHRLEAYYQRHTDYLIQDLIQLLSSLVRVSRYR